MFNRSEFLSNLLFLCISRLYPTSQSLSYLNIMPSIGDIHLFV